MSYSVKEIFFTLQGEGANAGLPAVFCRFTGCNLWSGLEQDRSAAKCRFCDTDFVGTDGTGGGRFGSAAELANSIERAWPSANRKHRLVVLTGGEPLLQADNRLLAALHGLGFRVAVETNGTLPPPDGIDWICVSPKANTTLVVSRANEVKVVWPQTGIDLADFENMEADHHFLQPMDGPERVKNTELCVDVCKQRPAWRLSLQTHKLIGIR